MGDKENKGISTIIASILMLFIVIALGGVAWLFVSGIFVSKTAASFSIAETYGDTITITNDGNYPIKSFKSVIVDGSPANYLVFPEDDSLVGYWRLDSSGSTVTDYSGQGNTGTFYGANDGTLNGFANPPTSTSGWTTNCNYGSCLRFDGIDDYVNCGNDASLDITNKVTVTAWVKFNSFGSAGRAVLGKHGSYGFHTYSTTLYGDIWVGGSRKNPNGGNGQTGVWYHLAVVYDGSVVSFYVNGEFKNSQGATGSIDSNTNIFNLGDIFVYDENFNGTIDEVRIYSRALLPAEVANLWANNASVNDTGLVGYWKLDKGSGATAEDSSMWKTVKYGGGLKFDGVDDYVSVLDDDSLDVTKITIMAWIKLGSYNPVGYAQRITDKERGTAWGLGIMPAGQLWFAGKFGGTAQMPGSANTVIILDIWTHVAVTYDGSTIKYYLNGNPDGTKTPSPSGDLGINAFQLAIGNVYSGVGMPFNGTIDEVRIYNRALNPEEIKAAFDIGTQINPGSIATVKIYDPLPRGTHIVRICTTSMCQAGYLTIV